MGWQVSQSSSCLSKKHLRYVLVGTVQYAASVAGKERLSTQIAQAVAPNDGCSPFEDFDSRELTLVS